MENKTIKIDNFHEYDEIVQLTEDLRIRNTYFKWADYIKEDGYIDFAKLDKLKTYYICIFTGYGTGKTFGLSKYVLLDKGECLGIIANTTDSAEKEVRSIKEAFHEDYKNEGYDWLEETESWSYSKDEIYDEDGEVIVKGAGLRNKGKVKQARTFTPSIIMFDEINQGNEQAEILHQDPLKTIGTIAGRWRNPKKNMDENYDWRNDPNRTRHVMMFANKDGKKNLMSVKVLDSLGIYGLSEYTEVFIVEKRIAETDTWYQSCTVFNPVLDEEKRIQYVRKIASDPERYAAELADYSSGLYKTGVANDDTNSWIFDNIYFKFKEEHSNLIAKKWYLYIEEDLWFEFNLLWIPNNVANKAIYMCRYEGMPEGDKFTWTRPKQDGVFQLPQETKDDILLAISTDNILYDRISTRVKFLQNFIK